MADATGAAAAQVDLTIQAGALLSVRIDNVNTADAASSRLQVRTRDGRLLLDIANGDPATIDFLVFEATAVETKALRDRAADFPAFYDAVVNYDDASVDRLQEGAVELSFGVVE